MVDKQQDKEVSAISSALQRAVNAVGVITILLTIGVFGLLSAFMSKPLVYSITLAFFGIIGAFEVFHRQRKFELMNRLKRSYHFNFILLEAAMNAGDFEYITIDHKFNHGGVDFIVFTIKQIPLPVGISAPLCPECGSKVFETANTVFPGRTRITFTCKCGWNMNSKFTRNELMEQATQLCNVINPKIRHIKTL